MISYNLGMQTAVALMNKSALEPLERKDSSFANPSLEPVRVVQRKMLRYVSFGSTFYNSDENLEDHVILQFFYFPSSYVYTLYFILYIYNSH